MFERFKRHELRRKLVAILYIISYLTYLGWRITIINPHSLTLSLIYFTAECMGFVLGLTIITGSWNYHHRDPLPAPSGLAVDVFIPTYKEPLELIRRTVIAAKEIEYPHQTWILDDGHREEVRAMAEELGLNYTSRPKNLHAKAGNLNYGLSLSQGDFILVLDADHIPLPHMLDVMLGFFGDDKVAMVQTPQDYYNTGAFQYINSKQGGLWHDQSFFYNIAQSCRDGANGVSCVGTGVIYRRTALNHIGGIPTETVTEDIHTSLKLHKAGYIGVYLNEPVSYGEAAPDLNEYYKTRHRWGHGNLHALQNENVFFCRGLTFKQRVAHLALGFIYLEGWQQLLLFSVPIATLVFGLQPFTMSIFNIIVVLLFPIFNYLLLQEIGCGFARYWANEIYAMARWPVQILATLGIFGRSMKWRTSSKNIQAKIHWRLMMPQLIVMALNLFALTYAIFRLHGNRQTGPLFNAIHGLVHGVLPARPDLFTPMPSGYTLDLVAIAGFWALYTSFRVVAFVLKAVRNAQQSNIFFRFPIPIALLANGHIGRSSLISENWMQYTCFHTSHTCQPGDMVDIRLFLPAGPLELQLQVETATPTANGAMEVAGSLIWSTSPQPRDQLARALYSVDWHREFVNRHAYFLTPIDLLLDLVTLKRPTAKSPKWWPCLYQGTQGESLYGVVALNEDNCATALVTFMPLSQGGIYEATIIAAQGIMSLNLLVIAEEPIASLVQKGLDGMVARRYRIQGAATETSRQSIDQDTFSKATVAFG